MEDLLDLRGPVLADVAGLAREDDRRIALRGDDDVRVAVDDLEAGQIRTAPSKPEYSLPATTRASSPCAAIAPLTFAYLRASSGVQRHESSSALTSAVTASFSGVGTPNSRPKRAIPPFR